MKKYIAELIGTFVLTLFGCGTAVVTGCSVDNPAAYLTTAIAFGLSIVAMAYSIGNVSGCHINPAVSFAMLLRKKLSFGDFIGYVIFQCCGAILAGLLLNFLFGAESGLGTNGLYNGNVVLSIVIEIILTCVFILAIIGVTSKENYGAVAGLVIGLSLIFVHILGIGLTGTSVNPARSLGPAIFAGGDALKNVWVFIVGPLAGGALAAIIYSIIDTEE